MRVAECQFFHRLHVSRHGDSEARHRALAEVRYATRILSSLSRSTSSSLVRDASITLDDYRRFPTKSLRAGYTIGPAKEPFL